MRRFYQVTDKAPRTSRLRLRSRHPWCYAAESWCLKLRPVTKRLISLPCFVSGYAGGVLSCPANIISAEARQFLASAASSANPTDLKPRSATAKYSRAARSRFKSSISCANIAKVKPRLNCVPAQSCGKSASVHTRDAACKQAMDWRRFSTRLPVGNLP